MSFSMIARSSTSALLRLPPASSSSLISSCLSYSSLSNSIYYYSNRGSIQSTAYYLVNCHPHSHPHHPHHPHHRNPLSICSSKACFTSHKYTTTRTSLHDKERVRDFVKLLDADERQLLIDELMVVRGETIPEQNDKSASESSDCSESIEDHHTHNRIPTYSQLRALAIHESLPFIGFGFLDNLIMIIAGDYIDLTLGVTLGISTMAAAGLGNALSDVAGVGSAFYVERLADKVGVRAPTLSIAQMRMSRTRWATQIGRAIGVALGCIIGMFPLLFLPHKSDNPDKIELEPVSSS